MPECFPYRQRTAAKSFQAGRCCFTSAGRPVDAGSGAGAGSGADADVVMLIHTDRCRR